MSENDKKPNVIQELIATSLGTLILGVVVSGACVVLDMLLLG